MKDLNSFLTEVKGEKAHRDAVAMGLKYKGFGYWVDPNTGKVTHKTENDTLVPVDPDVESELAGKDNETAGMAAGGGASGEAGMAVGGMASAAALGMPDQAVVSGTADPDAGAKAPADIGWEAGPDGDNCINDEAPGQVPSDSFVGKTNYPGWQAGPDGSNFSNFKEEVLNERDSDLNDRAKHFGTTKGAEFVRKLKADRKINRMRDGEDVSKVGNITHDKILGMIDRGELGDREKRVVDLGIEKAGRKYDDNTRQAKERQEREEAEQKKKHAKNVADRVRLGSLGRKMGATPAGTETRRDADFLNKFSTGDRTRWMMGGLKAMGVGTSDDPKANLHKSVMDRLKNIASGDPDDVAKQAAAEIRGQKDADREKFEKQAEKDVNLVKQMNEDAKPFFSDPDYDLDDVGGELGEGVFRAVYEGADGESVVKEGEIGPDEMIAMYKMRNNPGFPTLLNGEFTDPFAPFSSVENNPQDQTSLRRGDQWGGKTAYFDPENEETFDRMYPAAKGRYAMSKAKGETLLKKLLGNELPDVADTIRQIYKLRRDMHMEGISHNDMHLNNMMVDDDGTPTIIDLGLAKDNRISALMEALGGITGEDSQFFQMPDSEGNATTMMDQLPSGIGERLRGKRRKV